MTRAAMQTLKASACGTPKPKYATKNVTASHHKQSACQTLCANTVQRRKLASSVVCTGIPHPQTAMLTLIKSANGTPPPENAKMCATSTLTRPLV